MAVRSLQKSIAGCSAAVGEDVGSAAIDGGVDLVQWRVAAPDRQGFTRCRAVCAERKVPLIVNNDVMLAVRTPAHGAHVGQDDLPPEHRLLCETHWERYRERYRQACARLERESHRWQEHLAMTRSTTGWDIHEQAMSDLLIARANLHEEFISVLSSSLPPVIRDAEAAAFEQWRTVFRSLAVARRSRVPDPR